MEITTYNEKETKKLASEILSKITPKEDEASILFLEGDLGAGKTTFVQGLAEELGVEEEITSPTFVIQKIYLTKNKKFKKLIHMDCYRLKNKEELKVLGIEDILRDPLNLVVVEWPEHLRKVISQPAIEVDFNFIDDKTRKIAYDF